MDIHIIKNLIALRNKIDMHTRQAFMKIKVALRDFLHYFNFKKPC